MEERHLHQVLNHLVFWVLLISFELIHGCNGYCLEEERLGLLDFKAYVKSNGDDADLLLPSWTNDGDDDCCSWERVSCNSSTGRIINLSLDNTRQIADDEEKSSWSLNISLFHPFKGLTTLNLSFNAISDFADNEGSKTSSKLNKLEHIDLSWNYLGNEVLRDLGGFSALKSVHLQANFISGLLSDQDVANLSNLEVLNLRDNELNGTMPIQCFRTFNRLEILDLSGNYFIGSIPPYIGELSSLKSLSVSHSNLNGLLPIHQGFCELKKLEKLDISNNMFQGTIPQCINNLKSLRWLDLSSNQFGGNISSFISALTALEYIDVSHNLFDGMFHFSLFTNHSKLEVVRMVNDNHKFEVETEYPVWTPSFQLKVLVLSSCNLNKLTRIIPTFLSSQYMLSLIDLSSNNLSGRVPDWFLNNKTGLQTLRLRNNSLVGQFHLPPEGFLYCQEIDVSDNQFYGKIQENIGELLPNGLYLNFSRNLFEGSLPSSIGDMGLLVELDLSFNNFSGEVPPELGANLVNLQILKLSANKFRGELFSDHFNLTWLRNLQLDNNQFTGLSNASPRFFALGLLDASNNIISGKIPSWIGDLRVSQLDLSSNDLTGEIPPEIGSLGWIQEFNSSYLYALNLSHNQLAGTIPKNFSNLREIRSLDLSYNNLSGVIPPELSDLHLLEFFSLAHNNLTGRIPDIKAQAGAFDSSSYEGNPFLCGLPLKTRCRA